MMKINYLYNDNSTCSHVGIVYTFNIEKNDLPAIFLLANLLEKKGNSYHNTQEFYRVLDDLFGARINLDFIRSDNVGKLIIFVDVLKKAYVGEELIEKVLKVLLDYFNSTNEKRYDKDNFESVKNEIIKNIIEKENRPLYKSSHRAILQLDEEFIDGYSTFVSSIEFSKVTLSQIQKVHKKILCGNVELFYEGEMEVEKIETLLQRYYPISLKDVELKRQELKVDKPLFDYEIKKNIPQTALSLVFRLKEGFSNECYKIYQLILGHLLFKYVREEKGYCYSIFARTDFNHKLLLVNALVGNDVVDYAIQAISDVVSKAQLSQNLLDSFVNQYLQSLKSIEDSFVSRLSFIQSRQISHLLTDLNLISENCLKLKIEDIQNLDQSAALISTYYVKGEQEDDKK